MRMLSCSLVEPTNLGALNVESFFPESWPNNLCWLMKNSERHLALVTLKAKNGEDH